jgi:hypothetical protein
MDRIRVFGVIAAGILFFGGCKTTDTSDSQAKALAILPVTLTIAGTIIENLVSYNLELQWDRIYDKFLGSNHTLGDANEAEIDDNAKLLSSALSKDFQRSLKIKLNSLQDTMSRDYVAGSPDSSNILALMLDKTNDLRNALQENADLDPDSGDIGNALASYRSYLLVSSLNLMVLKERVTLAQSTPKVTKEAIAKLKGSVVIAARENGAYIRKINGPLFERYARKNLFSYQMKSLAAMIDFGFESSASYAFCLTDKAGLQKCGQQSQTVCKTELDAACVTKAQFEARDNFQRSGYEAQAIGVAREKFFIIDLDKFVDRMQAAALSL